MTKNILLIATGSIAAYKIVDLIRGLENNAYKVTLILTGSATSFVSKSAVRALTDAEIYNNHSSGKSGNMDHINLAKESDLIVVAPSTADFIAKMAGGFSDSLALSAILVSTCTIMVFPAMNPNMFLNRATQENISCLKERGVQVKECAYGQTACKDIGYGKYLGNEEVVKTIDYYFFQIQELKGYKAVITLGGTRENIDPVRYICNYSTGETGALIINELLKRGCEVHAICGYKEVELPAGASIERAFTASDMLKASEKALPADIFIGSAAISDFRPKTPRQAKLKKEGDNNLSIELEPCEDVIAHIGNRKYNRPGLVVGFALETENYKEHAIEKLNSKGIDWIISNKAEHLQNQFNDYVIYKSQVDEDSPGEVSKQELAEKLVLEIVKALKQNNESA